LHKAHPIVAPVLAFMAVVPPTLDAAPIVSEPDANGFRWSTVGDPGNRPTTPEDLPSNPEARIGSVGYEYRIAQTEVSNTQWLAFVRAYAPYYTGDPTASGFVGYNIVPTSSGYQAVPGTEQHPAVMEWRMAARYCNWLTNNRATNREAFESGAYDTSTFTINPNGTFNDQLTHTPGAAYWIPTEDEWVKAVYWDQNRYGQGQGGYWRQPYSSDLPAVSGLPDAGGHTNAGVRLDELGNAMNVGSYPMSVTPWGLLDASGGQREWNEKSLGLRFRQYRGSQAGEALDTVRLNDMLSGGFYTMSTSNFGLRIASLVPSPAFAFVGGILAIFSRRIRS